MGCEMGLGGLSSKTVGLATLKMSDDKANAWFYLIPLIGLGTFSLAFLCGGTAGMIAILAGGGIAAPFAIQATIRWIVRRRRLVETTFQADLIPTVPKVKHRRLVTLEKILAEIEQHYGTDKRSNP